MLTVVLYENKSALTFRILVSWRQLVLMLVKNNYTPESQGEGKPGWEIQTIAKREKNRFLMGKKAKASRASTSVWGWARWPQEVPSSLNDSVKHRLQVAGPQEQHTGRRERRFWGKMSEQRPRMGLNWHSHSENQVRERHGVLLRDCSSFYTQHDPNPEVPWWVLVFYSLSSYDPIYHWNMIYLRSLNCFIFLGGH